MKNLLIRCFIFLIPFSGLYAQVNVTVDWEDIKGEVPRQMFSLNLWDGINPEVSTDTVYQNYLKELNLPLVRIHGWEMIKEGHQKCWVDYPGEGWDSVAVSKSIGAIVPNVGEILLNIPGYTSFIDSAGEYAAWCASLVDLVNNKLGYHIKYWEPFNERQDEWTVNEMVDIYNKCAEAMKAVDSTILVGGPAVNQPWWNGLDAFIKGCKESLDFVSYHNYAKGSVTTNEEYFNSAKSIGSGGSNVRGMMNVAGLKDIPLFNGEYNIFWTWTVDQKRLHYG
ncbi:MAG: hypothetical protein HC906_11835 [Bacteroidales bacterium]|nr:hypothetical protein [Bacteroidales bacterium]